MAALVLPLVSVLCSVDPVQGPRAAVQRVLWRAEREEDEPVLRVVSSVVTETFTSELGQNKVGTEEPRIGCRWAECGICLKPLSEASTL